MEQHRFPVDVLVLLVREGRILLTQRAGDIYMAGYWAVPGGKVNAGETVIAAARREAVEEVGIVVPYESLHFFGVTHHRPPHGDARIGFGFVVPDVSGEPENIERDKCSRIAWFAPDDLPEVTMPYTKEMVRLYREKETFSLHDW